MKKKKKLLIGIVVAGIIVFLLSLANFLSSRLLRPKLEKSLTGMLERPVKINRLNMNFVFGRAVIKGVTIKNLSGFPSDYLLKTDKIIIEGSFLPFWRKKLIVLRRLVVFEPEINIDYLSRGRGNLLALFSKDYSKKIPLSAPDEKLLAASHKGIFIKKLLIKEARINFRDYEKGSPYLTVVEKVDIGVNNFTHWLWARGLETLFIIKGELSCEPAGDFEIQGKINYSLKKKLSGALELVLNNMSLVHFAPYYLSFLHLSEVESGRADIYARIKCEQNNLTGASKLVIKDYTLRPKDKDGASIISIGEGLKGEAGQLELMVRIGGTIEKPTYILSTDISEAKMREFFKRLPGLNLSATLLEGARKAGSGIGKPVGDFFGKVFFGKKD
ncbi:MAG: DUF748 domain-containing protein [Candidatus Ratteibacteria bacterium]|nr:DUF748 domain-containing protein [Candidatus Ratteibacteria bacterium]